MNFKRSVLKHLLDMRQSPGAEKGVSWLAGFDFGFGAAQEHLGARDEIATEFFFWLRDVRGEFPGEGWWVKLTRDCGGDEVAAAKKFLALIEEFLRLKGIDPGRSRLDQEHK